MRAKEFVTETILDKRGKIQPEHERAFSNTSTFPNQNMYHGSGYLHSQFLKALAGAGSGKTPDANMGDKNWAGGDPIFTPYHPAEEEMVDRAMKHIGDNKRIKWGSRDSKEVEEIHKISPVSSNKKNKYGI